MNIIYEDFIGIYDNVFPDGYCDHIIREFDRLEQDCVGHNRQVTDRVGKHIKNDYQIMMNGRTMKMNPFMETGYWFICCI